MGYQILVVEDQNEIASVVLGYLQREGYEVTLASNGIEALKKIHESHFHLMILDVMMPGIDGFEVLKSLRSYSELPVIMLTAKSQERDRIAGFDFGADDYVAKPFSPRELVGRVKALLKRSYKEELSKRIVYKGLELDLEMMKLWLKDQWIGLTYTEFLIMQVFMKHPNRIFSREELMRYAFGETYDGFDRNIDSYVKRLRQKIEDDPKKPLWIQTKYGAGYMFGGELYEY